MEPLIGVLSGLAVAITGLGGTLWRVQQTSRKNGHHQSEQLRLLQEIKDEIHHDAQDRRAAVNQIEQHFASIAGSLEFLKGRMER